MSSREDGFLSRWARRKAEVRKTEVREAEEREEAERLAALSPQELSADEPDPSAEQQSPATLDSRDEPPDEATRQRWIEELEAVDIDTLTYDNDFTIFMKSWVPGPLRQRALRKLWTTNPALAVLDGLNDYDLDYTDAAMQAGHVVSSYMPGRGYAALEDVAEKITDMATDEDDLTGAGEDEIPEFEAEPDVAQETAEHTQDDAQNVVDKPAEPAADQQPDETAIAVPQNDVKLKT